jgi:hypothetical protein
VGDFVVERLRDELLVYDTESDAAHCLNGAAANEFAAAPDDLSRREVLRQLALAGAAAAGTGALVKSIAAPTAAQAQSNPCPGAINGTGSCAAGEVCCGTGQVTVCCPAPATTCCFAQSSGAAQCCLAGTICCVYAGGLACCDTELGQACDATLGCVAGPP